MRIVLHAVLALVAIAGILVGGSLMKVVVSAVHEIEALLSFLIAAVAIGTLAIAATIEHWGAVQLEQMKGLRSEHTAGATGIVSAIQGKPGE